MSMFQKFCDKKLCWVFLLDVPIIAKVSPKVRGLPRVSAGHSQAEFSLCDCRVSMKCSSRKLLHRLNLSFLTTNPAVSALHMCYPQYPAMKPYSHLNTVWWMFIPVTDVFSHRWFHRAMIYDIVAVTLFWSVLCMSSRPIRSASTVAK